MRRLVVSAETDIAIPPSDQGIFAQPLGHKIGPDQENNGNDALEHAGCRGYADIELLGAILQHENIDGCRVIPRKAAAKQILNFKPGFQQMADIHNQQDHKSRFDPGEGHVQDALEAPRAVDGGGFIQAGVDGRHGGNIDDGAPADFLPNVDNAHQPPEIFSFAQPEHGLPDQAHAEQQLVHRAVADKDILRHADHDDHGQEMGQVSHGLHGALELGIAHFIQQHCQQDGRDRAEHQIDDAHRQGVADRLEKVRAAEQPLEVGPADIRRDALGDIFFVGVIQERVDPAPHGRVIKQQHIQQHGHGHQRQLPLLSQRIKEAFPAHRTQRSLRLLRKIGHDEEPLSEKTKGRDQLSPPG